MHATSLPSRTQIVADVIGRDRALYLVRHWKRTKYANPKQRERVCIYIPAKLAPDHELVRVMGWHDAAKLVAAFRGEILTLSTCECVGRAWRNEAIRDYARKRMKTEDIAFLFNMSSRQVRNVVTEMPNEGRPN